MVPLVLIKRSISVYLMVSVFLIAAAQPLASQVVVEDPIDRCKRIAARSERLCYLQLEEALMQLGGTAAVTCLAGFLGGSVPIAIIICLIALGITLSIILNLTAQYNLCVEQAREEQQICIETNCT